jgi:hypothetical protein
MYFGHSLSRLLVKAKIPRMKRANMNRGLDFFFRTEDEDIGLVYKMASL